MHKQLKVFALLGLTALAGCATPEQITAGVTTLEGKSYKDAFERLGYPDAEEKVAGNTVYIWQNRNSGTYTVPTTQTATSYAGQQTIYTTVYGSREESFDHHCILRVAVDKSGTVINTRLKGNIGGCQHYAKLSQKK